MGYFWSISDQFQTRYASDLSLMMRVLVGEEVAENKLRLSQRVNFKNVRVFYMEELKSVVIQPLKPEMRQSVKKVDCGVFFTFFDNFFTLENS